MSSTRAQYWAKIQNMKKVANRNDGKGRAARTRLSQFTHKEYGATPLSTREVRQAYTAYRQILIKTYKAQRSLHPKASKEYLWRQVELVLEDDSQSFDPYPDGDEGGGED